MEAAELQMRFTSSGAEGVKSDIRGVDSGIDHLGQTAERSRGLIGGMFSVAGGILGAKAIGHVLEWGKGILMLDANAEQAKMSLETVTGSAEKANTIFQNIQDFAAKTPYAFPDLVQSTINLEAFGLKSSEWLPVIGDTASAMGKSVDQVTQAVLDASSGQYERLKELGIMAGVEGDKLTFRYMKDGQMISETVDRTNQEVINSTIAGIWNDKYEGAMERQSKSFAGQWSTVQDNISMRLQAMSAGVFGFATDALGFVNDVFANGFVNTVRTTFGDGAADFVLTVEGMAGSVISGLGATFGYIQSFTYAMRAAYGSSVAVKDIVEFLPSWMEPLERPFLLVANAVGHFVRAFDSGGFRAVGAIASRELGNVWSAINLVWGQIERIATRGIHFVLNTTMSVTGWLWDHRGAVWDGIKTMVGWSSNAFDELVAVSVDGAIELGEDLLAIAADFGGWLWGELGAAWDGVVAIGDLTAQADEWVIDESTQLLSDLRSGIETMIDGMDVYLTDWHLHVGKIDGPSIDIDLPDISAKIGDKIKGAFVVPEGTAEETRKSAEGVGEQFMSSFLGGLNTGAMKILDLFGVGGGGGGGFPGMGGGGGEARITQWQAAVVGFLEGAFKPIREWEGWGDFERDLSDAWDGIKDALTNPDVTGWDPPSWPSWVNNPVELVGPVLTLIGIINQTKDALEQAWNDLQFWKEQTSSDTGGQTDAGGAGGGTGAGFNFLGNTDWADSGLDTIGEKVGTFADTISARFGDVKSTTESNMADASTAVDGFSNATADVAGRIAGSLQSMVGSVRASASNIASAFASLPGQLAAYGYNAVDAFARALWSGVAEATAAATAIAAAVDIAVASRLRIASPSRVMDEHGLNTVSPFLARLRDGASEAGHILGTIGVPSGTRALSIGHVSGSGGVINNYFVIESGAYVSADAVREIQSQAARGAAKIIDKRITNRRIQES